MQFQGGTSGVTIDHQTSVPTVIINSTFSDGYGNKQQGGAINVGVTASFHCYSCTFTSNKGGNGGAIFANFATISLFQSTFTYVMFDTASSIEISHF
jgi:hypothetical protein